MSQPQPIFILPEGYQRTLGKDAQRTNIAAAKQVAETVRTTLGPKGMDKMIVDSLGDITITNDGVTILQEMGIEHPAAKMLVEVAKTQEDQVGDGTTTAVVIAGELLKNAETLLDKDIHPTVITKGYRLAAEKAHKILNDIAETITAKDELTLQKIAITAMTGKGAESAKEHLAKITVKAVKQVADENKFNHDYIKIETKVGGSIHESELINGILLDKERVHSSMPTRVEQANIALIETPLEIKSTETDAKIQINDPMQLQAFLDQEEGMIKRMTEHIINSGANVVLCQKGIDDLAQHYLAKKGIYAARRVKQSDMEKLARATGATIISNVKELSKNDLGHAGLVEEQTIGDEQMTMISNCKNPKAVTLLIRGGTEHVTAEVERAVKDALGDLGAALRTGKVVGGAGAPEIEVAKQLRTYANSFSGREQLAILAFAEALEVIPRTLAENAGLDPIDMLTDLKAQHDKKNVWAGLDVFKGKVMDSWKAGIIEPLQIKTQAISSAADVAELILRIDDVIAGSSKGGQGPAPGMGGMEGMM